jgi:hypothetical protein
MSMIDPEQERQRLAAVYAGQSDEELASVAKQGHELTDEARETLRAELVKRGLYTGHLEQISSAGEDRAEFRDLATIRSFWSLPEAQLAKGLLDAAGIESFLFDENMVRVSLANVVGGIRLRVDAGNAEEAIRIVSEYASGEDALEESEVPDDNPST